MIERIRLKAAFLLVFLFFSAPYLFAQESSLLWKVSGNGLKHDSYVFGTIHIICEEQFMMNEQILSALESSDKLFLEIDMADPDLMTKMSQVTFNEGMQNIGEFIEEEDKELIDAFFKEKFGAGLNQLGAMKPFMLSSLVLTQVILCDQKSSYEQFFIEKAQNSGLEIAGLETIEFQAGLFDQIPLEDQVSDLIDMIKDLDKGGRDFDELVAVYLTEDIENIHDHILDSEMFANHGDALVYDRNKTWIPLIEEAMAENPIFVAVGSGHLGSEKGVIHLLKKQGYQVEPVLY